MKQFADAAEAFHPKSEDYPKNDRAPSAQMMEAYCLGKLYEADPTEPRRLVYTDVLKDHIEQHPRHETLGDAYWMLGQLEEQRLQNTMALTYYQKIPADHRLGPKAQLAVARCYEKVIAFLRDQAATAEEDRKPAITARALEWEEAGARELSQLVEAYPKEPAPWNTGQADVALELARLQLTRTTPQYPRADSVLERILVSGTQPSPGELAEWSRILKTSRQLRIVSLAGQGLSARAEELVKQLSESSTQDVLGVMDGLMQVARKSDPATRRKLGQLQLQTAMELNSRRQELDSAEQDRLDHCRAQAYLATHQPEEALRLYEQMLAGQPKSKPLHLRIAGLLGDADDPRCLRKAKTLWRTLEAQEKPGSETWLQRRYEVARCSWKLGETEEARKLLGVTKLLYPQLGNEELKSKFEQLEKAITGKR
jgi:tetratricopeptide (TPR) repeat protein